MEKRKEKQDEQKTQNVTERQKLIMQISQEALEQENILELSLDEFAERIKKRTGETLKPDYIGKIISTIANEFPHQIIGSFFIDGKKYYFLYGSDVVTTKNTANFLLYIRRLTVHRGFINKQLLFEKVRVNENFNSMTDQDISDRFSWAIRSGYLSDGEENVYVGKRLYSELNYLFSIADDWVKRQSS